MLPLVALLEVSPGPTKEGPRKDRKKDRETSNEAKMPPNLFRMTHFRKNASVTPFVSHTFKTKDLKPFRFTDFQKKVGGWGVPRISIFWFRQAASGHRSEAKLESTEQPTNLRVETLRLKGPE